MIETEGNYFFNIEVKISKVTMVKLYKDYIKRLIYLAKSNSDNVIGLVEALQKQGGLVSSSIVARITMIPATWVMN